MATVERRHAVSASSAVPIGLGSAPNGTVWWLVGTFGTESTSYDDVIDASTGRVARHIVPPDLSQSH
jgi:hypothetical protein